MTAKGVLSDSLSISGNDATAFLTGKVSCRFCKGLGLNMPDMCDRCVIGNDDDKWGYNQ